MMFVMQFESNVMASVLQNGSCGFCSSLHTARCQYVVVQSQNAE
jgi:hypothetical protein